jgi:hypothetical protein
MTAPKDHTATRIKKRSLPDLLVHKFLTEYGYDHGPIIARATVDDILATIEQCYAERVPPKNRGLAGCPGREARTPERNQGH